MLSGHRIALHEQMQYEILNGESRSKHLQAEDSCVEGRWLEYLKYFPPRKQASALLGRSVTWWGIAIIH